MNSKEYIISILERKDYILSVAPLGLHSGKSGLLLYLVALQEVSNSKLDAVDDFIEYLFSDIISNLQKLSNDPSIIDYSFCEGLTGVFYSLDTLVKDGIVDDEFNLLDEFDKLLYNQLIYMSPSNYWDLLYGYLGYGIYFLNRDYKEGILLILNLLEGSKNIGPNNSIYWKCVDKYGNITVDTGLAHGNAGILSFLNKTVEKGYFSDKSMALLNGLMNFYDILEKDKSWDYFYSDAQIQTGIINVNNKSRLAWCYGDLTILYNLYKACLLLNKLENTEYLRSAFIEIANKRDKEITLVCDPFICHGAAGLALIFKELQKYFTDEIFIETSKFWEKSMSNEFIDHLNNDTVPFSVLNGFLGLEFVKLHNHTNNNGQFLPQIIFL